MNTVSDTLESPPSPAQSDIAGLQRMQAEGRHTEVLQAIGAGANIPDSRDLLLLSAISHRHLRDIPQAMAVLDRLQALHPDFSRLHQERGLCHVQLKDADAAIQSLLIAVNLNPALPASWSMLEGLYRMTGDGDNARTAAEHVATLKALPAEIVTATALFSDRDLEPAEQMVRRFLLEQGDHPEAMRLLARIGLAHDVLDDAETLLRAVLELAPDYATARYDLAETLIKRQKHADALAEIETLRRDDPENPDYRSLTATALVGLGQTEAAIALYDEMIAQLPYSWDLPLWRGHALKTVGRVPEAVDSYRLAAQRRPDFGDAYWSLANLKTYRFTDEEIAAMTREEAGALIRPADRYHLCFALGKAHEDRKDAGQAWTFYERGNALKRAESRYRPEAIEANTAQQIAVCTADFFAARQGWGLQDADPIFVLGLPRAGSTLCEQILASHSQVEGTQELSNIQRLVLGLHGADGDPDAVRYPESLADLTQADVQRLAQTYLDETRVYRSGKDFFIDKMPNNFRHIGLIHLMFPNAAIIDVRRDPMSCCFSNLKQLFAQGQEFTYGIEDIARYYRTYLDLMEHWDRVLPGRILRVQHEDIVDDLEGSVARMLDYCRLPFEEACVSFHANTRSVRTPSSEQVRQPIFRDGLDQWKAFAPWLEPLQDALGDAVTRYRT